MQERQARPPGVPFAAIFVRDCVILYVQRMKSLLTMWRQTALVLARCTRSLAHHPRLHHGRIQAAWASNAVHLSGASSRFAPRTGEVQFRACFHDDFEGPSRTRFASQGEGFSRHGERLWEEERTASSYGGMLSTFYATRSNLDRKLREVLAQGMCVCTYLCIVCVCVCVVCACSVHVLRMCTCVRCMCVCMCVCILTCV